MKKKLITIVVLFVLSSCSKENPNVLCLKIQVIGYNYCSPVTMGAQILEGPRIGNAYGNYDNVISIHAIDQNRLSLGSILYVRVRDVRSSDNLAAVCLAIYPEIIFSQVHKVLLSSSSRSCK